MLYVCMICTGIMAHSFRRWGNEKENSTPHKRRPVHYERDLYISGNCVSECALKEKTTSRDQRWNLFPTPNHLSPEAFGTLLDSVL